MWPIPIFCPCSCVVQEGGGGGKALVDDDATTEWVARFEIYTLLELVLTNFAYEV